MCKENSADVNAGIKRNPDNNSGLAYDYVQICFLTPFVEDFVEKNQVQICENLFLLLTNLFQKTAETTGKRTFTTFLMICCMIQIFH